MAPLRSKLIIGLIIVGSLYGSPLYPQQKGGHMAHKRLADNNNRNLGYLNETSKGQVLSNKHSIPQGRYDARTNMTYDNNNRPIGKGNLLGTLINR